MRELLPLLPRPSRYLGIEEGAVHKDATTCSLRIALAFPDTYEVGMSYLGQKILSNILNSREDWWAERVMTPCRETAAILQEHTTPLATLESDTPLSRMHAIGFSLTHELAYTNILYMLDLGHIPLRAKDRGDDLFTYPIIIAGGGATLSAEPIAPFMDLMVLGEGEEVLVDICALLEQARNEKWSRSQFLKEARHIHGVYIPSLFTENSDGTLTPQLSDYTKVYRRVVADLSKVPYPVQQAVPIGAVHNRLSLEIARGCTRGCRFCHAGMVYRPVRERPLPEIKNILEDCLKGTGFDEISYLSLSTGDFSALKTLFMDTVDRCAQEQISVSLPSLRVGSIDDSIMQRMAGIRRTGATLAPEAGSQRLRDVINKGISEEELLLHIQKLVEHGWQQVKLYFMIGLPTETYEDLDAIVELCRKVRDIAGRGGPRLQVTAAISPFVPKPFTPFQWVEQISMEEIHKRIYYLRDQFKQNKGLKMRWHEPSMSHLEGIMSRGDRKLADVIEKVYHKGGVFSAWVEGFSLIPWQEAMEECGLKAEDYIAARPMGEPLVWDHLDCGISPEYFQKEMERALAEKVTADCRYNTCRQCGVCDTKAGPSRLPKLDGEKINNILNLPQRDQEAHKPRLDEEGRLICPPRTKAAPPAIAKGLTVKAVEYRIWHSRKDRSAFLSQLELQAILERCLRRAGLPMTFSQGFHPLPLISFGRALPVGVGSQAEWFAITLRQHLDPATVMEKLQAHLPQGMDMICVMPTNKAGRTEQATQENFCLTFKNLEITMDKFFQTWQNFLELEEFLWTRDTKKGPRTTDIRALISHSQLDKEQGKIHFTTDWQQGYLSPLSLVLALLGQDSLTSFYLEKTEQVFADGSKYPPMP